MAYDQELARRIRVAIGPLDGVEEKKMFGGVGFLLHGNMACGVIQNNLVVRLSPGANGGRTVGLMCSPSRWAGGPWAAGSR